MKHFLAPWQTVLFAIVFLNCPCLKQAWPAVAAMKVSLITDNSPGVAVQHGLSELGRALREKGIEPQQGTALGKSGEDLQIFAGLASGSGAAAMLLKELGIAVPTEAESIVIRQALWKGQKVLLVTSADDRGLMYGLLDVAERVGWTSSAKNLLREVRNTLERPAVPERALSIYTMQQAQFENRLFNEEYWPRYFNMLARDRFNSFVLIFGYENGGYFAPAYPWFFDVDGFPEVAVVGLTKAQQERNLKALNRLVQMAHERGLNFTVGLWDHIYRGGVQSGGRPEANPNQPTPGLVWGLTKTNLMAYSPAALAKFLRQAPDIDAVQLRMHDESGLKPGQEQHEFWKSIFQVVKDTRPMLPLTLRAKGLPDEVIDLGLDMGLKVRIATKYWAEQMGLPFHPTHINHENQFDRRHGYADLLRYPQRYKMHWRLWNAGTTRILLWGDPEYVRRFAHSTQLYDGDGFEVTEMLGTKMASHPQDQTPFDLLRPQYRYYDWEFERYWHFYQVFGRAGYNPDTPAEVWSKEFERRFGKEAGACLEQALHRASWILPRINAACFPYHKFPTTRGWAEKQRWDDLPVYAKAEGSDTEQFLSFEEAARARLDGVDSAKVHPETTSGWFAQASREVLALVDKAEKQIGEHRNKEFNSTVVDLRILAQLASYHSHRFQAAESYSLFTQSRDLNALDDAVAQEREAIDAWQKLVDAASDVYNEDLMMGLPSAGLSGHWKDELAALKKGVQELELRRTSFRPAATEQITIAHAPVRRSAPGEIVIRATVTGLAPSASVELVYGRLGGEFSRKPMRDLGPARFGTVIAGAAAKGDLLYFIEAKDEARHHSTFPLEGAANPIQLQITTDYEPPRLLHEPIATTPAGQPLRVTAKVRDPSGVAWVHLRYRSLNQHQDYRTLAMVPTGKKDEFEATIPGEQVVAKWDFQYLFEVMDHKGNGKIYPDLEKETPYIVVKLQR